MATTDGINIAVLDDYQGVALAMADWSRVANRAEVTVFRDHLADPQAVIERLRPFDVVCVMRERTPLTAAIIDALPRLRLICSTGKRNASIDLAAAEQRGIPVLHTSYASTPTIEMTWALILASCRHIAEENAALRSGGWQGHIGTDLAGKTLAILGLGSIGSEVARIGGAFGMRVIAWSQNLTPEKAAAAGADYVSKEALFREADILSIHLVLSARTRGIVSADDLRLMRPTARLINTSRGPIVVERDLLDALDAGTIAGAAIDVYDTEPLPADHPIRTTDRLLATPHIGYVSDNLYRRFYGDTVANIERWLDTAT